MKNAKRKTFALPSDSSSSEEEVPAAAKNSLRRTKRRPPVEASENVVLIDVDDDPIKPISPAVNQLPTKGPESEEEASSSESSADDFAFTQHKKRQSRRPHSGKSKASIDTPLFSVKHNNHIPKPVLVPLSLSSKKRFEVPLVKKPVRDKKRGSALIIKEEGTSSSSEDDAILLNDPLNSSPQKRKSENEQDWRLESSPEPEDVHVSEIKMNAKRASLSLYNTVAVNALKTKASHQSLDSLFQTSVQEPRYTNVADSEAYELDPALEQVFKDVSANKIGRGADHDSSKADLISLKLVFPKTDCEHLVLRMRKNEPFKTILDKAVIKFTEKPRQSLKTDDITLAIDGTVIELFPTGTPENIRELVQMSTILVFTRRQYWIEYLEKHMLDAQEASKRSDPTQVLEDVDMHDDEDDQESQNGAKKDNRWTLTVNRKGERNTLKIKCKPTNTIEQLCRTILTQYGETRIGMGLHLWNCDGDLLEDPDAQIESCDIENEDQIDSKIIAGGVATIKESMGESYGDDEVDMFHIIIRDETGGRPLKMKVTPDTPIAAIYRTFHQSLGLDPHERILVRRKGTETLLDPRGKCCKYYKLEEGCELEGVLQST